MIRLIQNIAMQVEQLQTRNAKLEEQVNEKSKHMALLFHTLEELAKPDDVPS